MIKGWKKGQSPPASFIKKFSEIESKALVN